MIDLINNSYRCKIITIEDPVEYMHTNQKALDLAGRGRPGHAVVRAGPAAGAAAGPGRDPRRRAARQRDDAHGPPRRRHRAPGLRDGAQLERRRRRSSGSWRWCPRRSGGSSTSQLASALEAVISQRLAVTRDGARRPAMEILRGGPVTSKFIMENRLGELSDYIASREGGMQRFDQHLLELYNQKIISGTEAMKHATNPEAVALGLRGIRQSGLGDDSRVIGRSRAIADLEGHQSVTPG